MGYVAGESILDNEFNAFVANSSAPFGYNHFADVGALNYGLGLGAIPSVDAGATITAAQFNALFAGIDNVANHTNVSTTTKGQVTTGDTIAIKTAVATDLATLATAVAGGSVSATAITESSELRSAAASGRFAGSHTVELTVTFANNNNMRYFFNAGGTVRIKLTRTGNGGSAKTSKDDSVDELIAAMGNFDIKSAVSTRGGSGETLTTDGFALGFYDGTTSYQTVFLLTQANGTYTSMTLKGEFKLNAAVASAVSMTVKMTLTDADSGDGEFTDGNTASVDQFENFLGVTDFGLFTVNPTTAQGLGTVYGIASHAITSNATA